MLTLVSFYDNLSPLLACSYSHFISWVLSQLRIINHPYFFKYLFGGVGGELK